MKQRLTEATVDLYDLAANILASAFGRLASDRNSKENKIRHINFDVPAVGRKGLGGLITATAVISGAYWLNQGSINFRIELSTAEFPWGERKRKASGSVKVTLVQSGNLDLVSISLTESCAGFVTTDKQAPEAFDAAVKEEVTRYLSTRVVGLKEV